MVNKLLICNNNNLLLYHMLQGYVTNFSDKLILISHFLPCRMWDCLRIRLPALFGHFTLGLLYILSALDTYFKCEQVKCAYLNPTLWKGNVSISNKPNYAANYDLHHTWEGTRPMGKQKLTKRCVVLQKIDTDSQLTFQVIYILIRCKPQFSEVFITWESQVCSSQALAWDILSLYCETTNC